MTRITTTLTAAVAAAAWLGTSAVGMSGQSAATYNGSPLGDAPTFSKDVAPILYKNCVSCHRPGEAAPMSLMSYHEVRPYASAVRRRVLNREMPPWTADPQYGHFRDDRELSTDQIRTLVRWVDAGAKEGDPKDLPPPPHFEAGWQIGKPDVIFEMPVAFEIPASGEIPYQYFEVPTDFKEDTWVQAVESRYGDPAHVHHLIVSVLPPENRRVRPENAIQVKSINLPGQQVNIRQRTANCATCPGRETGLTEEQAASQRRAGAIPLVNHALGEDPPVFPEGTGRLIPAGSTLVFQMHYTANGTVGHDRSKVGMIFAKRPLQQLHQVAISNNQFVLPAGASNYQIEAEGTFTEAVKVWSVHGHMHLRGKDMQYDVTYPDGRTETIFRIPKWDFAWQQEFWLDKPLELPKGSKIHVTAHFDNSPANIFNPDPKAVLTWGDQVWEEMMGGFIQYTVGGEPRSEGVSRNVAGH
jgi:hypothetical protein